MSTITFDSWSVVKTLKDADLTEKQAVAISNVMRDSHNAAELATKGDLREVKAEVKAEMREMELRIDKKFAEITGEMLLLKWMMGVLIAGVVAALLKLYL